MALLAQEWLTRRLADLEIADLEGPVEIFCTEDLVPPPCFQEAWRVWQGEGEAWTCTPEEAGELQAVLIFSNPCDEAQVRHLVNLIRTIDTLGQNAPPILWVPHTIAPEHGVQVQVTRDNPEDNKYITELFELGLDGIIDGEPEGFRLSLAVKSEIHKQMHLTRTMSNMVSERRAQVQQHAFLQDTIDLMLWDYIRLRLAPVIPAIDYDLPAGDLQVLDNYIVGQKLGSGVYGTVYKLEPGEGALNRREQVVKVMDKTGYKDLSDVKLLGRHIEIMNMLASEQWAHPNVVRCFQTYHSMTHIFFRMEYGGPENLFRRLNARSKAGQYCRPLSVKQVVWIMSQLVEAVAHIHLGPRLCHRDIKPENFTVMETPDRLTLKLMDFDMATVQHNEFRCRSAVGTVPFTAPEVLLENQYDGIVADLWALGILLFEVCCGVRVVEEILGLTPQTRPDMPPDKSIGYVLQKGFGPEGLPSVEPIIEGLIQVDVNKRWRDQQVSTAMQPITQMRWDSSPEATDTLEAAMVAA
eukprot:CAMPEP_0115663400 /NCGR_PEP_ID=MMETSP0272-20121206/47820_1 /TAXON_ID=71861 /ORGANISM="Scrippsiella trochoidea, Strain CCMP3099" /LENGTH=523 /DNA_ID=CAMNT_0003101745 /DNA_START=67 /DNA_END=1634 /DNA_ORIENTATION=-